MQVISGIGQLCMVPTEEEAWFQGLFFGNDKSKYGLMGVPDERYHGKNAQDHPHVHPCCFSPVDPPIFYKVTLINFQTKQQLTLEDVVRSSASGDRVRLGTLSSFEGCTHHEGEEFGIEFSCEDLLLDEECKNHMARFFPKLEYDSDCIVCVGPMKLLLPAAASMNQADALSQEL